MKKSIAMLLGVSLLLIMSACSLAQPDEQRTDHQPSIETEVPSDNISAEKEETTSEPAVEQPKEEEPMKQAQFYITANSVTFPANFADNGSADAFRELLREGDLTIHMSDYGSFEKVGSIGTSLPHQDTQIETTTGDVMLYQGSQIVIFYGTNQWSYSRLGRIDGASAEALLDAFGSGDVAMTFSLTKPQ